MTEIKVKNIDVNNLFNIEFNEEMHAFAEVSEYVPNIDENYIFDQDLTEAILKGLKYNKKILVHGMHGTGKSTHIEQIAARLNWPVFRVNLDGYITRTDLVGRDTIAIEDNKQIIKFKEGIIPWAIQQPIILILDEYDAARPDVLFVIQRLLENDSKFTLVDENKVMIPHQYFRLIATCNTIGMGDSTGLYSGTHILNQGQIDRWQITLSLDYLPQQKEEDLIRAKVPELKAKDDMISAIVNLANLTREGFQASDINCVMSPRTSLNFAENLVIFRDTQKAFKYSFFNKSSDEDKLILKEYYQRAFAQEL